MPAFPYSFRLLGAEFLSEAIPQITRAASNR
jgi:hypothetical protein